MEGLIADAWKIQDKLRNDPHRPRYHFMPREAWMNDINGAIFNGIELDKKPVLRALVTGLSELYRLGRDFGYEDSPQGYVSSCHLCMDIRNHLVRQTDEFEELRPKQIYSHL